MEGQQGSGSGCLKKLLIGLLVVLFLAIVTPIVLFFLAFGAPKSYPAPVFYPGDTAVVANIITRLARSLVDKEGRVVETAVLKLSRDEVQTLLDAALRNIDKGNTGSVPYAAMWEDGYLKAYCSIPFTKSRAANLAIELIPGVDHGTLTLTPRCGSLGQLPLPGFMLDSASKEIVQVAMRSNSVRTTLSAFTRIEPGENGSMILMFDPRDVNTVVRILRAAGRDPSAAEEDDDEDREDDAEDVEGYEDREDDAEYGEDDEDREDDGPDDGGSESSI